MKNGGSFRSYVKLLEGRYVFNIDLVGGWPTQLILMLNNMVKIHGYY